MAAKVWFHFIEATEELAKMFPTASKTQIAACLEHATVGERSATNWVNYDRILHTKHKLIVLGFEFKNTGQFVE